MKTRLKQSFIQKGDIVMVATGMEQILKYVADWGRSKNCMQVYKGKGVKNFFMSAQLMAPLCSPLREGEKRFPF